LYNMFLSFCVFLWPQFGNLIKISAPNFYMYLFHPYEFYVQTIVPSLTRLRARRWRLDASEGANILLFVTSCSPGVGPIQPPPRRVLGAPSLGVRRTEREVHFHLVPRLLCGAIRPFLRTYSLVVLNYTVGYIYLSANVLAKLML
jgi:hypothetical protein